MAYMYPSDQENGVPQGKRLLSIPTEIEIRVLVLFPSDQHIR